MDVTQNVQKGVNFANKALIWIGYALLGAMILLTLVDVVGRQVFNKPLKGSLEVTELIMAVLGGLAMWYTAIKMGHIAVDILVARFSKRVQEILSRFGFFLGFMVWAIVAYRVFLSAKLRLEQHSRTSFLYIPQSPFEFVLGLGLVLFCLTQLYQALRSSGSVKKKKGDSEV